MDAAVECVDTTELGGDEEKQVQSVLKGQNEVKIVMQIRRQPEPMV